MGHKQVPTQANVLVDEGIEDLIHALSSFGYLRTIESCQGDGETGAWVCFEYGTSWLDLAEFVFGFFGPNLVMRVGDSAKVSVVQTPGKRVQGELAVRPGSLVEVVPAIANMAEGFDK